MDEIAEIEENLEKNNYTFNETDRFYYEGLYPHQIGMLFFSVFCLIPNVFIIYIVCRNRLSSTIYWSITNWSVANIVLILNFLSLCIIPPAILGSFAVEFIFHIGITLLTLTGAFVTLLMFDFFIKSKRICKYSIATVWLLILSMNVAVILFSRKGQIGSTEASIAIEVIFFLVITTFAVKVIHSCIKPSFDDSYRLRIRLCSTYLVCIFLVWASDFMLYVHVYYIFVTILSTITIYLNGYVNLIVLIYFDPRIKRHFLQTLCKSKNYADINFDPSNSVVQIVQQTP